MSTAPHPRANASASLLVGQSQVMQQLAGQLEGLSRRACTVLLLGETGTGKELAARSIHLRSARADKPFVPVDCTTLRDALLDSQLFGHTRGAFTGADRATLGFFRAADTGTLFLDEIGELPLQSQAKLLRCIQERNVVPLGATSGISADVRVIAATHRDLLAMVRCGEFREDLFYRLNVASVRLPPLRERMDDVPLLVRHALEELARLYQETPRTINEAAMQALQNHAWPGNVRELINAIEHALVFSRPEEALDVGDLPEEVRIAHAHAGTSLAAGPTTNRDAGVIVGLMTLEAAERQLIAAALRACGGNQTRAARALAIERHRLRRRIVQYQLLDLVHPPVRYS